MFQKNIFFFSFTSENMEFQEFPPEILLHIVSFVTSVKDINSFSQTCSLHNAIVRENDEKLVRKTYGTFPKHLRFGSHTIGFFHITPFGVMHGSYCAFYNGDVTTGTRYKEERFGFEMTVCENDHIKSGFYREGERFGLWRHDSREFRECCSGFSQRDYYDKNGHVFSHSKNDEHIELITVRTENSNISIYYKEISLREDFFCENTKQLFCAAFRKTVYNKELDITTTMGLPLFHCCEEHREDMPVDILYTDEPEYIVN